MTERKIRKLMSASIPIETLRLQLRYIQKDDVYDMYEYASIPEVSQYLLWYPHVNIAATEGYIESLQKRYIRGLYADWALVLKSTGKMIGTCGYANLNAAEKSCEIGYVLSPDYRHHGYMTEAVEAVLKLSFEILKLNKAVLRIITDNNDSIELAKRLGFNIGYTSTMVIKESKCEVAHYILTADEYKKMKQSI